MIKRALLMSVLILLSSIPAFAKTYSVANLSVDLALNCKTGHVTATDPTDPIYVVTPNMQSSSELINSNFFENSFVGSSQGFTYSIDSSGQLVLTHKKPFIDFFGHDTSIVLGTPDSTVIHQWCQHISTQYDDVATESVPIDLAPSIVIREGIEWTGSCSEQTSYPNHGYVFERPFAQTLIISDMATNKSVSLTLETAADLGNSLDGKTTVNTCNAVPLP